MTYNVNNKTYESMAVPIDNLPLFTSCCPTLSSKYISIQSTGESNNASLKSNLTFQVSIPAAKIHKVSCGFEWIRQTHKSPHYIDFTNTSKKLAEMMIKQSNILDNITNTATNTTFVGVTDIPIRIPSIFENLNYGELSNDQLYSSLQTQSLTSLKPTAFPNERVLLPQLQKENKSVILRQRFLLPASQTTTVIRSRVLTAFVSGTDAGAFLLHSFIAKRSGAGNNEILGNNIPQIGIISRLNKVPGFYGAGGAGNSSNVVGSNVDISSSILLSPKSTPTIPPLCICDVAQKLEKNGFSVLMNISLHCDRSLDKCMHVTLQRRLEEQIDNDGGDSFSVSTQTIPSLSTCQIALVQVVNPFMFGDPYEQQIHEERTRQHTQLFDFVDVENMGEESRATTLYISHLRSNNRSNGHTSYPQERITTPTGTEYVEWKYPLHTKYALALTESQDIYDLSGNLRPLEDAMKVATKSMRLTATAAAATGAGTENQSQEIGMQRKLENKILQIKEYLKDLQEYHKEEMKKTLLDSLASTSSTTNSTTTNSAIKLVQDFVITDEDDDDEEDEKADDNISNITNISTTFQQQISQALIERVGTKYGSRSYLPVNIIPPEFEVVCRDPTKSQHPVTISTPFEFIIRSYSSKDKDIDGVDQRGMTPKTPTPSFKTKDDSAFVYIPIGRIEHFSIVAMVTAVSTILAALFIAKATIGVKFAQ